MHNFTSCITCFITRPCTNTIEATRNAEVCNNTSTRTTATEGVCRICASNLDLYHLTPNGFCRCEAMYSRCHFLPDILDLHFHSWPAPIWIPSRTPPPFFFPSPSPHSCTTYTNLPRLNSTLLKMSSPARRSLSPKRLPRVPIPSSHNVSP